MTDVAAGGSASRRASKPSTAPLDDMMLAMDVVDTLRHQQALVSRELGGAERDEALLQRLRGIYAAQGIAVTDAILEEGVEALRDERFVYRPPAPSAARRWATVYVRRGTWLRRIGFVVAVLAVVGVAWYATVRAPTRALAADIETTTASVLAISDVVEADARAEALSTAARAAIERGDRAEAREAFDALETLEAQLRASYVLEISQASETGFWRVPDVNQDARNYYIVVEAIGPGGEGVSVPIRSEETGRVSLVERWALRVDEATFERIRADKLDDGIVQDRIIGEKAAGRLEPEYRISTSGEAITEW